jgi:hypothetical protein
MMKSEERVFRAMAEAEVTLRLAFWFLDKGEPNSHADLAVDGAHVRIAAHQQAGRWIEERTVFPIEEFLAANDCEPCVPEHKWRETFTRNKRTLSIRSVSGFDFQSISAGKTIRAECKGGPLEAVKGQSVSGIFAEAIGQTVVADSSPDDELWVAVPDSRTFERVGLSITRQRTFKNTGIRIALVAENGEVRFLN